MKPRLVHIFCSLLLMVVINNLNAIEPYCTNLGFELKDFTNWRGYTWVDKQNGTYTNPVEGFVTNRHQIITTQGYDPILGGTKLKLIPDGFTASAKLGSTYLGNGGLHQSLQYDIDVTESNALVIMHYAVLLLDPFDASHEVIDEPRFKLTILDEQGNTIPDCANYDVYASNARVGGWQESPYSSSGGRSYSIFWRDWTAVGINLTNYIGKKITIEFLSANCRRTGHFGYAYFTAECLPLYISVDYCTGNSYARLNAPSGFELYEWKNQKNEPIGTQQSLIVNNPSEGDTYSCSLISATGCEVSLTSTIYRYEPNAVFNNDLIDCNTLNNTIHFNINNPPTHGWLKYNWDFSDGTTSTEAEPDHLFESVSGWTPVTLTVENPPSSCKDTYTKNIEIFNPPYIKIVGDTTYCPGETVTLKGVGADHYNWKLNGQIYTNIDSITVGAPGGEVELTGFTSNNECSTTKYRTVIEEPYWPFTATPDTFFCKIGSVTLNADGAVSYLWTLANKPDSILSIKSNLSVEIPGEYSVTGRNINGCEKTLRINVAEIDLPTTNFTVSPLIIDSHHNKISCSIVQESGVNYFWNFGDNDDFIITGNNVTYYYQDLAAIGEKTVTLKAINAYSCENSDSLKIIVVPFFPNVFTPNNDNINDKFLRGINVKVIDRNGLIVFNGDEGWNGKFNNTGNDLSPDTYFYFATYSDHNQQRVTRKGNVTLIRVKQ